MTRLHELYESGGQSPWLDDLKRSWLNDGHLKELIDQGVRGLTSNPTIMAKAIEGGDAYDEQFAESYSRHGDVISSYWDLVIDDVSRALDILRPLYDESGGGDGFVSIEVAPDLARDTEGTIKAARLLHERIDRPNLFVKIPATKEGIPAIRRMIAEGRNTNITLIFSIERYEEVIEAYLGGLEELLEAGGDLSAVSSVASFFVSRVDTEADRRLERLAEERGGPEAEAALGLRGRAAVAQARLAYERFEERFSRTRWERLAGRGGRLQRPLWASTSTKNPAYPDLAYVETLIGENTVNTMPEPTLKAFEDHGKVERTVTDYAEARTVVTGLSEVGVELADVARTLEEEGVAAFEKSFDEVRDRLSNKAAQLGH